MKKSIILATALCAAVIISSCKKHHVAPVPVVPTIPVYINQPIIDTLEKHGMDVNLGLTPPSIDGFYLFDPYVNTYSSLTGGADGGNYYSEIVQFFGENSSTLAIGVAYNQGNGVETGKSDTAVVIRGTNNLFTVFANTSDTTHGIVSESIQVYSGQLSSTGILSLQYAFYLKSKSADPYGYVVPVGTVRVFKDGDGVSEPATSLSQVTEIKPLRKIAAIGAHSLRNLLLANPPKN